MPSYTWVSIQTRRGEQHRYRDDTTGRYLPARAVRADLDRFVDRAGRESARALTEQLRDGRIALPEWQTAMARAVKNVNYAAVAAASGGVENMTAVERGRAGALIREQYKYLRGFAADIASGKQKLDGTLAARARLYSQAGRNSYYRSKAANMSDRVTHQRSIRGKRDSCWQCIELDRKVFRIDDTSFPLPGRRVCNHNCGCHIEYLRLGDDGEYEALEVA